MKRFLLIFCFLLGLFLCACEADPGTTHNPTDTTNPTVKTVYVHSSVSQTYGDTTTRTEYLYSEDMLLTEVRITANDKLSRQYQVTCDENGNPIHWEATVDGVSSAVDYTFDEQGRLLGTYAYSGGELMTATENTWGNGLRVSVTARSPRQGYEQRTEYSYDENHVLFRQDRYINGALNGYTLCTCNEDGKLTESHSYSVEGALQGAVLYTYEGNTETRTATDKEGNVTQTQMLVYDDHGNLLSAETYTADNTLVAKETHEWLPIQVDPDCPRASI